WHAAIPASPLGVYARACRCAGGQWHGLQEQQGHVGRCSSYRSETGRRCVADDDRQSSDQC
ncbi:unnamed protein product, partial [Aphanomyces euteiches]